MMDDMSNYSKLVFLIGCLCIFATVSLAGCVNTSATSTVDSANEVVNSMNHYIENQKSFDNMVGKNIDFWNAHINSGDKTYYAFMKVGINNELKAIDGLQTDLEDADNKIIDFSGQTVNLNGNVKTYADQSLTKMRLWQSNMEEYCNSMSAYAQDRRSYLNSVEAGYPDDTLLASMNNAKNKALSAITKANDARSDMNDLLKKIEKLQ
ncbi:hypothetical protein [Methanoregula sp.]|uniref:hypothetical protein n=1 Tax=Methanoregula sp. TaxID=2052170 RepID=UPI002610707B|nr:hypothetical protein [Methanoregula sp.]MDD5144013.1 hypothetical protein [Methanoregula sp.]